MLIKVHFAIIAAIFDYNPKVSVAMKSEYWEKCMPAVEKILDMLAEDTDDIATGEAIADEDESFEAKPFRVRGCFLSAVERLDEEFTKVHQSLALQKAKLKCVDMY